MKAQVNRAGSRGLLLEAAGISASELHELAHRLGSSAAIAAVVPGSESLLILFRQKPDASQISQAMLRPATGWGEQRNAVHRLRVSFADHDGPDLAEFLQRISATRTEFLRHIESLELRARFVGFRAGFAYLDGWPTDWRVPRRSTSRQLVPAGSFACAGAMAGFYPEDSPGGWNLLGRTDATLWDPWRDRPNLLSAGDEIRVEVAREPLPDTSNRVRNAVAEGEPLADVVRPGQLTSIVAAPDLSRLRYGLATGGPFDTVAAASANVSVGNPPGDAVLECVLVGPDLVFRRSATVAWRGASAAPTVDGRPAPDPQRVQVEAGGRLQIGALRNGLRGWLAVSGGIAEPPPRYRSVPGRLRAGDALMSAGAERSGGAAASIERHDRHVLEAVAGPHRVPPNILNALESSEWIVTPAIDRTGLRFRATALPGGAAGFVAASGELPSIGAQFGSVQWHPSGELVALGPDHPVTGGYLQPFNIVEADLWKLAQLRPGDSVRWKIQHEPQLEDLELHLGSR